MKKSREERNHVTKSVGVLQRTEPHWDPPCSVLHLVLKDGGASSAWRGETADWRLSVLSAPAALYTPLYTAVLYTLPASYSTFITASLASSLLRNYIRPRDVDKFHTSKRFTRLSNILQVILQSRERFLEEIRLY